MWMSRMIHKVKYSSAVNTKYQHPRNAAWKLHLFCFSSLSIKMVEPVLEAAMQAQVITQPRTCFTVELIGLGYILSPYFCLSITLVEVTFCLTGPKTFFFLQNSCAAHFCSFLLLLNIPIWFFNIVLLMSCLHFFLHQKNSTF